MKLTILALLSFLMLSCHKDEPVFHGIRVEFVNENDSGLNSNYVVFKNGDYYSEVYRMKSKETFKYEGLKDTIRVTYSTQGAGTITAYVNGIKTYEKTIVSNIMFGRPNPGYTEFTYYP